MVMQPTEQIKMQSVMPLLYNSDEMIAEDSALREVVKTEPAWAYMRDPWNIEYHLLPHLAASLEGPQVFYTEVFGEEFARRVTANLRYLLDNKQTELGLLRFAFISGTSYNIETIRLADTGRILHFRIRVYVGGDDICDDDSCRKYLEQAYRALLPRKSTDGSVSVRVPFQPIHIRGYVYQVDYRLREWETLR